MAASREINLIVCNMGEAVIEDQFSKNQRIVTFGVAACSVVVIHHPGTNFTIFSHIYESNTNVITEQEKFLKILAEKGIPLEETSIYLAGGNRSEYTSNKNVNTILEFWKNLHDNKRIASLDTEHLFARDCIPVPNNLIQKVIKTASSDIKNEVKEILKTGQIYHHTITIDKNEHKAHLYIKNMIASKLTSSNVTLMIKITNPDNPQEERYIMQVNDPKIAYFFILGFDKNEKKLFISEDQDLKLSLSNNKDTIERKTKCQKRISANNFELLYTDLCSSSSKININALIKNSPVCEHGNKHDQIVKVIKSLTTEKESYFKPFLKLLEARSYGRALRTICNAGEHPQLISQVVEEMLKYKDELSINIDETGEQKLTPLYFACKKDNKELYLLLLKHGADPALVAEDLRAKFSSNTNAS